MKVFFKYNFASECTATLKLCEHDESSMSNEKGQGRDIDLFKVISFPKNIRIWENIWYDQPDGHVDLTTKVLLEQRIE